MYFVLVSTGWPAAKQDLPVNLVLDIVLRNEQEKNSLNGLCLVSLGAGAPEQDYTQP